MYALGNGEHGVSYTRSGNLYDFWLYDSPTLATGSSGKISKNKKDWLLCLPSLGDCWYTDRSICDGYVAVAGRMITVSKLRLAQLECLRSVDDIILQLNLVILKIVSNYWYFITMVYTPGNIKLFYSESWHVKLHGISFSNYPQNYINRLLDLTAIHISFVRSILVS